ncbi:MAG: glycosyltransferase [Smithellaceae bacterium]|nr:glycosyltransferase [Smithellaceae bacterium]
MRKAPEQVTGEDKAAVLSGRDFVVFSDDWGRHPFSCQHIIQHFLPQNNILWVNTIGMRLPRLTTYDVKRAVEKILSWTVPSSGSAQTLPDGLRVIAPVMIPFSTVPLVRAFNRWSVIRAVQSAMRVWDMQDPVLLATQPLASEFVGRFGESAVVYYCVDDFANWPDMNIPELVRSMEEKLLDQADLVVAVSDHLVRTRPARKGKTRLLTHGVDVEHFRRARTVAGRAAVDGPLTSPVIGFFGLLDNRMDWELVSSLVERRPEWTFVFIGNAQVPLMELTRFGNFRHVPAVPYEELPSHAAAFDVAILPYVVDRSTAGISPLKLKEYLALDIPVVTTPLPGVMEFKEILYLAAGMEEFDAAILGALQSGRKQHQSEWIDGEAWVAKAEILSGWMDTLLLQKRCIA